MTELHLLWAWVTGRLTVIREHADNDEGFTTLEWVAIASVVVVAAILVATVLMNTAKNGARSVNIQ